MYKSPINIIYGKMQTQMEGDILRAVQQYGIDVDKEELIQELQYDRGQYEKGYAEGKAEAVQQWIPVTERLPEEEDADEHDCVLVHTSNRDNLIVAREAVWKCTEFITHWQPLHEPQKGE